MRIITQILVILLLLVGVQTTQAKIVYVNHAATGANDGTSWTDAYTDLNTALAGSFYKDTVMVAKGIYKPHASDRSVSFSPVQGVAVFGGFVGDEVGLDSLVFANRDFVTNETILSGDLNGDDDFAFNNISDNSYHVIRLHAETSAISSMTKFDGFTVQSGNADYWMTPYHDVKGGGAFIAAQAGYVCSPTLENMIFEYNAANTGAAICIAAFGDGAIASPGLTNVEIRNNEAILADVSSVNVAAGLYIGTIDGVTVPTINSLIISNNNAGGTVGSCGGLVIESSTFSTSTGVAAAIITGLKMCSNTSTSIGSNIVIRTGDANANASATIKNATIGGYSNTIPVYCNGVVAVNCAPQFTNTILATSYIGGEVLRSTANPSFAYSMVQGSGGSSSWDTNFGMDNGNNIDEDPLLADTSACNFDLLAGSPCLSAGNGTDGDNIGWFQTRPLDIDDLTNIASCQGDAISQQVITIDDDDADLVIFAIKSSDSSFVDPSMITVADTGITREIDFAIPGTQYGAADITFIATNNDGEIDSTVLNITLSQTPLETGYEVVLANGDQTFNLRINEDSSITNEEFSLDEGATYQSFNYFYNVVSGNYKSIIRKGVCLSDTIDIVVDPYLNDVTLAITTTDPSSYDICGEDTTITISLTIVDDNVDAAEISLSYDFIELISEDSISMTGTGASREVTVKVPQDSMGTYTLRIHGENIYMEMANIQFSINMGHKPTIDTVILTEDLQHDVCAEVILVPVSGVSYNSASVRIDSELWINYQVQMGIGICNQTEGMHNAYARNGGCISEPYEYNVVIIDPPVPGSIALSELEQVMLFPVPAKDVLNVSKVPLNSNISIMNTIGQELYRTNVNNENVIINIADYNSGIYIMILEKDGDKLMKQFIIDK